MNSEESYSVTNFRSALCEQQEPCGKEKNFWWCDPQNKDSRNCQNDQPVEEWALVNAHQNVVLCEEVLWFFLNIILSDPEILIAALRDFLFLPRPAEPSIMMGQKKPD